MRLTCRSNASEIWPPRQNKPTIYRSTSRGGLLAPAGSWGSFQITLLRKRRGILYPGHRFDAGWSTSPASTR